MGALLSEAEKGITLAACWAHVRRYFYEIHESYPAACGPIMETIQALYKIERKLKDADAPVGEILSVRDKQSRPLVETFENLITAQYEEETPGNALGKALAHARKRMPYLKVFLESPTVPLDTNYLERSMKHAAMLRKNFLFFGSSAGGKRGAVLMTLALICRELNLDAWRYFRWALTQASLRNPPPPETLTPAAWAATL